MLPSLCLAALKPGLLPFLWDSPGNRGFLDSSGCCRQKEPTSLTHYRRPAFPLAQGRQLEPWPCKYSRVSLFPSTSG